MFPPQLSSAGSRRSQWGTRDSDGDSAVLLSFLRRSLRLHSNVSLQREHPAAALQLWLCFPLMKLRPWPATANMLTQHKTPPPLSSCQPLIYSCCSCSRSLLLLLLLLPQRLLHAVCRRAAAQWMLTEPCCPPMIYILQSCFVRLQSADVWIRVRIISVPLFKIQICESIPAHLRALNTGLLFRSSSVTQNRGQQWRIRGWSFVIDFRK